VIPSQGLQAFADDKLPGLRNASLYGTVDTPQRLQQLVIDPGPSFGAASHPTTRMCLELLGELEPGGMLVDWGTGSGVLAIAAARLGFAPVYGVELDPAAAYVARRNALRNGVDVTVSVGDVTQNAPIAPTVLANLTLPLLNRVSREQVPARLIASGFLAGQRPDLPMKIVQRRELEGWAALVLEP